MVSYKLGQDEYLSVTDVAQMLGISAPTVRLWDKKGILKASRHPINHYRLYKRTDVERLLKKLKPI